jgi:hypothetical protein
VKEIHLDKGKIAIVDEDDYNSLSQFEWKLGSGGYARRWECSNGKVKTILMHREVNKTPKGFDTDHINGNRLDNRKCNLRTATRSQNIMNQGSNKGTTSKFKGVSWKSANKKWVAQIVKNGKSMYLGLYKSEEDAARAYNEAALKHHGQYAWLNQL